ncbi:MAG: hypothetical protein GY757_07815 [bacterium]|nr:hypothetical protein [bacterium]
MRFNTTTNTIRLDGYITALTTGISTILRGLGAVALGDIDLNFQTQGGNIGRRWKQPRPFPTRKRLGAPLRDTKALQASGHIQLQGNKVYVVYSKTAQGRRGRVNIAAVLNNGAKIEVTDKMRAWLHFHGVHLSKDTKYIVIEAREFMKLSRRGRFDLRRALLEAMRR